MWSYPCKKIGVGGGVVWGCNYSSVSKLQRLKLEAWVSNYIPHNTMDVIVHVTEYWKGISACSLESGRSDMDLYVLHNFVVQRYVQIFFISQIIMII